MKNIFKNKEKFIKENNTTLEILQAVDTNNNISQRSLSAELGIALGMTNLYLKKCIDKGLLKIKQTPKNRFLYYLTAKGFLEKAKLTKDYLRNSFNFYTNVKKEFYNIIKKIESSNKFRVILSNQTELSEIFLIASMDSKVRIKGVLGNTDNKYLGLRVFKKLPKENLFDFIVYTGEYTDITTAKNSINLKDKSKIIFPEFLIKKVID